MRTMLAVLVFLTVTHPAFGQVVQSGLILPASSDRQGICCVYSPKEGFSVYDGPDGKKIGVLTRDVQQNRGSQYEYRIYFVDSETNRATQIDLVNFREIDYEILAVTYFERTNGFVRVVNDRANYWLKESEIEKQGFVVTEWQTFLSDNAGKVLGFYANEPGLNLRQGPNTDAKVMMTLRGKTHQISPTGQHDGLWTKVKVTIHKEHPCRTGLSEEENIVRVLEGWVKIVDDSGEPNVWFYTRGC